MTTVGYIVAAVAAVVAFVVGFPIGIQYRKKVAEKEISSAEEEATRILNEAIKSSESKKREVLLEAKEEILKTSRELIRRQGWSAVSIRSVAAACGVSVGSIYNYFGSKAELVGATVESGWCEIFHRPEDPAVFRDVQA